MNLGHPALPSRTTGRSDEASALFTQPLLQASDSDTAHIHGRSAGRPLHRQGRSEAAGMANRHRDRHDPDRRQRRMGGRDTPARDQRVVQRLGHDAAEGIW